MEKMFVRGVTKDVNVTRISIVAVPDVPGVAYKIFSKLAAKNIVVDIILQSIGRDGTKDITRAAGELRPAEEFHDQLRYRRRQDLRRRRGHGVPSRLRGNDV